MENATLEQVRVAQRCAPTQEGFIRFQALEFLLRGYDESEVSKLLNFSVRTIEKWRNSFNFGGIDAVAIRGRSGRPRKISPKDFEDRVIPLLEDPSLANEAHWTGVKLHGYLRAELKEELGYSTLLRYLNEGEYRHLMPRKWPERQDPELREQFLSTIRQLHGEPNTELWFCDECGFEGDPRPRRVWVKRGSKPKVPYFGNHIRANVVGAVQPQSGAFFSLVVSGVDQDVFQVFLDQLATETKKRDAKTVLVLDNAAWHKGKTLNWHHITPCYLPPYSPDLNPIETLWRWIKENFFTQWYAKSLEALIERLCTALKNCSDSPNPTASVACMNHLLR